MIRRTLYILLLLVVILDAAYSFMQHYGAPLDGDIAESVVPAEHFKPVLENVLGIRAIKYGEAYPNPNRFFVHWSYREYMISFPVFLQRFTDPISSVYLSTAIAKIIIQLSLIMLLPFTISGTFNLLRLKFILAAFLVTPLFQTEGYRSYMGIIDPAITYTFSYALPALLLLLYFLPFIMHFYHSKKRENQLLLGLLFLPLGLVVSLSGPLNPGIVLVIALLVFLGFLSFIFRGSQSMAFPERIRKAFQRIPIIYWVLMGLISMLSLYSLYLGQYNSHQAIYPFSLSELYLSIPQGIYEIVTEKPGFPILFLILAVNSMIISRKLKSEEGKKILNVFKWIGLFALIYILLLPLGGYREYRPYVLRYDTILPITLALVFMFGATTLYIIKHIKKSNRRWYFPLVAAVLLTYTFADNSGFSNNSCEKAALEKISGSSENVVKVDDACTVLSWDLIKDPKDSDLNARLLQKWGISDRKVLYFQ